MSSPTRYQKRRDMLLKLYSFYRNHDQEKADRIRCLSYRLDFWQWQKPVILNVRKVGGA